MWKNKLTLVLFLVIGFFSFSVMAADEACNLTELQPVDNVVKAGIYTIHLDGGSVNPTTAMPKWAGTIRISENPRKQCTIEKISAVELPMWYVAGQKLLYVFSRVNGTSFFYAVDLPYCELAWSSEGFKGTPTFSGGQLSLGTNQAYALNEKCLPFAKK